MTGSDILRFLLDHDIMVTPSSIRNWAILELIPLPAGAYCEKGSWFGFGWNADYPSEAGAEAMAAYLLLRHITREELKHIRVVARCIEDRRIEDLRDLKDDADLRVQIQRAAAEVKMLPHLVLYYCREWLLAKGVPQTALLKKVLSPPMQFVDSDTDAQSIAGSEIVREAQARRKENSRE